MRPAVRILLVTALLAGAFAASATFLKPVSPVSDLAQRGDSQVVGIPAVPPQGRQDTRPGAADKGQRLGWLNRQRGWLARLAEEVLTMELVMMPVVVAVMAVGLVVHLRRRSAARRSV
jgi:hypothetical protein